jgi:methionyl-tRNA formyltransferase
LSGLLATYDPVHTPHWPQSGPSSYFGKVDAEDVVVPYQQTVQRVFARARAAAPWLTLVLWVPAEFWFSPADSTATASASRSPARGFVRVSMADAVPFASERIGPPGTLRRSEAGGLAIACKDGTVFFRTTATLDKR